MIWIELFINFSIILLNLWVPFGKWVTYLVSFTDLYAFHCAFILDYKIFCENIFLKWGSISRSQKASICQHIKKNFLTNKITAILLFIWCEKYLTFPKATFFITSLFKEELNIVFYIWVTYVQLNNINETTVK